MVVSENGGNLILTTEFEPYRQERKLNYFIKYSALNLSYFPLQIFQKGIL